MNESAISIGNTISEAIPIISVGAWERDEDNPIFPVGANPKRLLICPDPPPHDDLIAGHRYLFKTAQGWKAKQFWSEFIAYKVSMACQVPVPRCFIAANEATGEPGALIEFFYGYPDEKPMLRLVPGYDLLQRFIRNRKTGRPHSIKMNVRLCRRLGIDEAECWWGKVLVFDALIGNTDRHPENWGTLIRQVPDAEPQCAMAPAFDNGTSLGYEILDYNLPKIGDGSWFEKYLSRGTHHCGWDTRNNKGLPHFELCGRFAQRFPAAGEAMKNVILFDEAAIEMILGHCTAVQTHERLSGERATFIAKLLTARRRELERVLL